MSARLHMHYLKALGFIIILKTKLKELAQGSLVSDLCV